MVEAIVWMGDVGMGRRHSELLSCGVVLCEGYKYEGVGVKGP
jgi:hypothetical protein